MLRGTRRPRGTRRKAVTAAVAGAALVSALAACSSGSAGSAGGSAAASGTAGSSAGAAAAAAAIKPYVGQPGPFPVTTRLAKLPASGATMAYMDCGTPVCALFYSLLAPAAKTMGVRLTRVNAGSAANTVSAAFDSVISQKPAAVITTAINVQLWASQLKQLQAAKIPVVTTGITGLAQYGVLAPQAAEPMAGLWGKLMADYVAAKFGQNSNVVFYDIPELPFTLVSENAFTGELAKVCSGCLARAVPIPVATIGNTAPNTVVSDLQAHPSTTAAVFGSDEAETGLPSALQAAGIKVKTMGVAPTPTNLEYVKEGKETATLGYDLPVASWELVDQAAREIAGQKLTGPAAEGIGDVQFLTQQDITFNPALGWTGYPHFAQQFAQLWGVTG